MSGDIDNEVTLYAKPDLIIVVDHCWDVIRSLCCNERAGTLVSVVVNDGAHYLNFC